MLDHLPYEILQLVASGLLPRSRCKLAFTSKWCYRYVYNDLLRWHARKDAIPVPTYHLLCADSISLRGYNNTMVLYKYSSSYVTANNLVKLFITYIHNHRHPLDGIIIAKARTYGISGETLKLITRYGIGLLNGYYKYMPPDLFKFYAQIRMSPLLSLPYMILRKILYMVPYDDRFRDVHYYMHHVRRVARAL